jgi:hypothetical protein
MQSKLQHIAQTFVKEVGDNLHNYTFVFPNHRAGLFFRKYVSQYITKPIFAPRVISINECFASLTELSVPDQLTLLLRLYRIYCQLRPKAEPLEEFLHWGKMMLSDFSEVDNHLVKDVQSLYTLVEDMHNIDTHFSNLSAQQIAAIKRFWGEFHNSREKKNNHSMHTHFVRTWELLYPLYQGLTRDLLRHNIAYEGLLHRHVIEHWEDIPQDKFNEQYVFIGFNATTESERQLMLHLQEMGRADFYFDYDNEYLRDKQNVASMFMQDNLQDFHSRYDITTIPEQTNKQINLISVSSAINQTHQVHKILSQIKEQITDWTRTAVVLPNEELLIPMIHTIPSDIDKINVTMGYPLRATSTYMLIAYPEQYISPLIHDSGEFIQSMRTHLEQLINPANSESIYLLLKTLDHIEEAIHTYSDISFTAHAVQQLLKMLTLEMTIPYTGEPLEGLQIMGVLETRALDFDNIIITDFNDDIYPGRSRNNSFIPYTLRRGFNLPTVERQDAIFAYNFYRMLSHAKNIWFIANTHADEQHSGELSRYYYQLIWQYQIPVQHTIVTDKLQSTISERLPITKTDSVLQLLSNYYSSSSEKRYLSASAISEYLRCQKAFYYKHLEHIHEQDADESISISNKTLGNVLHAIMQHLYTPLEKKQVQKSDIQSLVSKINNDQYWKSLSALKDLQGDELADRVVRSCVSNTLYYDYENAPFEYIASEQKAIRTIHLPSINQHIDFLGKIDRIDIKANQMRVIDYKTGSVKLDYSSMPEVFGLDKKSNDEDPIIRKPGNKYILQTLLYCWLLETNQITKEEQNKHANTLELAPHLFPTRQLHNVETNTCLHDKNDSILYSGDIPQEFVEELTNLLDEIFNPNIPFYPTEQLENCKDCYLAQICALKGERG